MAFVISRTYKGSLKSTYAFLNKLRERKIYSVLDTYGQRGVDLLMKATPKRTGATAASWSYEKHVSDDEISLEWRNNNLADDGKTPIVILIIKGHGTPTGGYVSPNDFVTPTMEPLFAEAAEAVWKAVKFQ